jgi:hypothetical protein
MSFSARVLALVAIGVVILAGAFALVGGGSQGGPLPSTAPSVAPSAAAASPRFTLADTFISPTYGYSVGLPAGWTRTPATKIWSTGTLNLWNSGFNDELSLVGSGLRFSGASQTLAPGQTADEWLAAYANGADPASWPTIRIDGKTGYLTADDVAAAGGTVWPGGTFFDAVVVDGQRAFNFNMDGKVDRAIFDQFIGSIKLDAVSVGALPKLDASFVSPWYGYRIPIASSWTTKAATAHWHGVNNEAPAVDEITITGTDTGIPIASQPLAKGTTFEEWLEPFHEATLAAVPVGCDGGAPSTWPALVIGDQVGRLEMLCNAAEALVEVKGRVYVFDWGNQTFNEDQHLAFASWVKLLESVTFTPETAVDR